MFLRTNIHQMCTNIRYVDGFRVYASCSANSKWPETIWRFFLKTVHISSRAHVEMHLHGMGSCNKHTGALMDYRVASKNI